ncbi:type II toxin-antitoxin system VapC family toxin [uncultured Sphaerotilus sp.]|jgi:predicted nucleic acid-binding protein|uniref:type II toxin-antitoxin system VapC family toxin n=1 Tax=Sphaerotilus montanus TaxID=522889 RepID=UPI0030CA47B9
MSGIDHLLDTNIVIGLLKGSEPTVMLAKASGLVLARAGVSQITRMELLGFPGLGEVEERATRAFLGLCQVVAISDEVEARAIRLRRAGLLKLPDAIVAASALVTGAQLLTLDQRLARVMANEV